MPFPRFLGEVLSIFSFFWGLLAYCIILVVYCRLTITLEADHSARYGLSLSLS